MLADIFISLTESKEINSDPRPFICIKLQNAHCMIFTYIVALYSQVFLLLPSILNSLNTPFSPSLRHFTPSTFTELIASRLLLAVKANENQSRVCLNQDKG